MANPWVEKYRPRTFESIVLTDTNKRIMESIVTSGHFPNLLFYGPPGTGKTTTVINLIHSYQDTHSGKRPRGHLIHLNASDERGIDIIRNHIQPFVTAKSLFTCGVKFVILDEVDYMTKNAQQALKYLIQLYIPDVRFCLICNYISKIDASLQNEFVRLHFNQLPCDQIIPFLETIIEKEHLNVTRATVMNIQKLYKSDIRSMINFLQTNQHIDQLEIDVVNDEDIQLLLKEEKDVIIMMESLHNLAAKYKTCILNIIKHIICYIVKRYVEDGDTTYASSHFFTFIETIIHNPESRPLLVAQYFCSYLIKSRIIAFPSSK